MIFRLPSSSATRLFSTNGVRRLAGACALLFSATSWAQIAPGAQFDQDGSYIGDANNTQVVCYTDGTCARVLVPCDTYVNGVCVSDANTVAPPVVNDNIVSGYSGYYDNGSGYYDNGGDAYPYYSAPQPRRWHNDPPPMQVLPPARAQPLQQPRPAPVNPAPIDAQRPTVARPFGTTSQQQPQQGFVPQHQTGAQGGGAGAGNTPAPQQGSRRLPS